MLGMRYPFEPASPLTIDPFVSQEVEKEMARQAAERAVARAKVFRLDDPGIPEEPAVYFPFDELGALDVGETGNLRQRNRGHERKACWLENAMGEVQLAAIPMPGVTKAVRRAVESNLRRTFKPPCGVR